MATLFHKGVEGSDLPQGFSSNFSSVEEALAQAIHDVNTGREPAPDRITDGDSIVFDAKAIAAEAKAAKDAEGQG